MNQDDSKKEVTGIILFFLAVALILIFYLPVAVTGVLGSLFRSVGMGFLGKSAYAIPIFILYAAFDYFFEKRSGVSKVRVRSVILLLVCVSAILAIITMDMDYFRTLTVNSQGKESAISAIKLLWSSGVDSKLIQNPTDALSPEKIGVISGGVLGGMIAIALDFVLGNTIGTLAIVVFFLTQIILVFQVSIKTTAKKTARAINTATNKAYKTVKQRAAQNRNPNVGQTKFYYPENRPATPLDNSSRFVNNQGNAVSKGKGIPGMEYDPFNTQIPIDVSSGFIDVSAREFGADTSYTPDKLKYGEKQVNVDDNAPKADFTYTSMPLNAPYHEKGTMKVPSFLNNDAQKDFFDLEPEKEQILVSDSIDEDDGPYEVYESTEYDSSRRIRTPHVSMGTEPVSQVESYYEPQVSEPAVSAPVQPVTRVPENREISINAKDNNTGYSATEGRIIETNKVEPTVSINDAPNKPRTFSRRNKKYIPAPTKLLAEDKSQNNVNSDAELKEKAYKLENALKSFGIDSKVINITHGPAITRFELTLATGIKVSKVLSLQDDISLAMAAVNVRIEAPIPGKSAIGIEIPNEKTSAVQLRGLLESPKFRNTSPLTVALGKDIPGEPILCDLAKMPHLLIAGSTGSGKSVCINTILTSILCKSSPDEVRMILVDPKVVELSIYNGIPHLIMPVVTDPKKAAGTLKWAVAEMTRRYALFAENQVRDIKGYNEYLKYNGEKPLPLIVIVVDELADLMTVAAKEVEEHISRLAAMARAAGLHLLIATQRPSVDVITGVIKANIPSRIAFAVSSGVDSRTILDSVGAEKLLGKGDMLYAPLSAPKPVRGQGAFVSDKEVESIVNYLKSNYGPLYDEDIIQSIESGIGQGEGGAVSSASGDGSGDWGDDLFEKAVEVVIENGSASVSILQRKLGIGYPRAARLVDMLESNHFIGKSEGSKPRKVLINDIDWLEIKAKGGKK